MDLNSFITRVVAMTNLIPGVAAAWISPCPLPAVVVVVARPTFPSSPFLLAEPTLVE